MSKKTVLVVDDEKVIRELIHRANDFYGFQTIEADDGDAAWKLYQECRPDLVISDINMPRMNGILLMKNIRQSDPNAKVILITGYANYSQRVLESESSPDYVIEKPFQIVDLEKLVHNLLDSTDDDNI